MKIWRWPIFIAVLGAAALLIGLIFDGAWDGVATLMLGLPVLLSYWFGWSKR